MSTAILWRDIPQYSTTIYKLTASRWWKPMDRRWVCRRDCYTRFYSECTRNRVQHRLGSYSGPNVSFFTQKWTWWKMSFGLLDWLEIWWRISGFLGILCWFIFLIWEWGNIEIWYIFGMNNFIAYQMETFFSCFFGNAIQKMFVCRSTVITFLKECQQMNWPKKKEEKSTRKAWDENLLIKWNLPINTSMKRGNSSSYIHSTRL